MNFLPALRSQALAGLLLILVALLAGFLLARSPNARAALHQAGVLAAPAPQTIGTFSVPVTETVNYQGILRNADGAPIPSGNYTITVATYESADIQFPEWDDTFVNVPVRNGTFQVVLGGQRPLNTLFINSPIFVGVRVNGLNGGLEFTPRQQVRSVPLATYANHTEYAAAAGHTATAFQVSNANYAYFSTTADYLTGFTKTVYAVNAWGSDSSSSVEVTSHKNNKTGTMCMLTAVQVEQEITAPSCMFNDTTSTLTAGRRNKCELTCFTFSIP